MRATFIALAAAALAAPALQADVTLPAVFTDHMVLQRNQPLHVFGGAQPNEAIVVELRDASGAVVRTGRTTALQDSRFSVEMPAIAASAAPLVLEVRGANTVRIEDVLVGDVWVAGGQSNMEWSLGATNAQAAEGVALANDPLVRFLKAPHVTAHRPSTNIDARWQVLTPQSAPEMSAIAFWFALDIRKEVGVPVGILSINWGGTRAEPWIDLATLSSEGEYADKVIAQRKATDEWDSGSKAERDAAYEAQRAGFQKAGTEWWNAVNSLDPGAVNKWFAGEEDDAAAWRTTTLPMPWSKDPELANFDGVVWYRRSVEIPAEWAGKECFLDLGAIDDADVAFFNGRAIANTIADWQTPRHYRIPASMVKAGPALLVLEVLDIHGEGGTMSGADAMKLTCPAAGNASIALAGEWRMRSGRTAAGLVPPPARPVRAQPPGTGYSDLASMFHGMISPFAGYAVKGAIWYQGESNAGNQAEAEAYRHLLALVVRSWRTAFGQPDMPFGIVSLAAFHEFDPNQPCAGIWPALRDSQLGAEGLVPNAGVVTTIDVGDARDIHPRNKRVVGERLGNWAAAAAYAKPDTAWRGPRVKSARRDGDGIVVEFDVERGALAGRDGKAPTGFALAGADGNFVWCDAVVLTANTLKVRSSKVALPFEVRYAWQDNPANATLVDSKSGLPAHPFRIRVESDLQGPGTANAPAAKSGN